jgi:predicted cupin superfamily sugar epimerase
MTLCAAMSAAEMIALLDLKRHPEGGHYRQTFEDAAAAGERAASTAIYFLLAEGERSHWHRLDDAAEVWHFYAGAPLMLSLSADGEKLNEHRLGSDFGAGERPQLVVPAGCWQAARPLGPWTLVGCTVAPGFRFSGFELAGPGWRPGGVSR